MSEIAIKVENLSKRYRLGGSQLGSRDKTLKETISDFFKRPLQSLKTKKSADFWALQDVSFEIKQGEILGILGSNGAGKSTLLKILSRITDPTSGKAEIYGRIGALLEVGTGFHPELTGRENIYLSGAILGMKRAEIRQRFDEIVSFAGIEKFVDTPVKRYSSGMFLRLAFSVMAHLESEILFVDEVLAVGDLTFQKKCMGKIEGVSKLGKTIVFVSHHMESVASLCPRSILLHQGRLIYDGPSREVIQYHQSFVQTNRPTLLRDRTDRIGTGRFRFTHAWIENEQGEQVELLYSGGYFKFVLFYECKGKDILDYMNIIIDLTGQGNLHVTSFGFEERKFSIQEKRSEGRIECCIPKLSLNSGHFSFHLKAINLGTQLEIEDSIRHAGEFSVKPGLFFSEEILLSTPVFMLMDYSWSSKHLDKESPHIQTLLKSD